MIRHAGASPFNLGDDTQQAISILSTSRYSLPLDPLEAPDCNVSKNPRDLSAQTVSAQYQTLLRSFPATPGNMTPHPTTPRWGAVNIPQDAPPVPSIDLSNHWEPDRASLSFSSSEPESIRSEEATSSSSSLEYSTQPELNLVPLVICSSCDLGRQDSLRSSLSRLSSPTSLLSTPTSSLDRDTEISSMNQSQSRRTIKPSSGLLSPRVLRELLHDNCLELEGKAHEMSLWILIESSVYRVLR